MPLHTHPGSHPGCRVTLKFAFPRPMAMHLLRGHINHRTTCSIQSALLSNSGRHQSQNDMKHSIGTTLTLRKASITERHKAVNRHYSGSVSRLKHASEEAASAKHSCKECKEFGLPSGPSIHDSHLEISDENLLGKRPIGKNSLRRKMRMSRTTQMFAMRILSRVRAHFDAVHKRAL